MEKTTISGTLLVAAALAFGIGMPRPAAAQSDECLLQVQDATTALPDDGEACAEASGKICTFELKLCVNQEDGQCTPGDIKKKIKASGHCGPVGARVGKERADQG